MTPTQPTAPTGSNGSTDDNDGRERRVLVMWFVGALLVVLAIGGGILLLVDSGSNDSTTASTSTSTTIATTTTTLAPVTTAAPVTTSPPTTVAPSPCTTPQACAQALYDAWKHNDKTAAALAADPAAVTKMFSVPFVAIQTNSGPMDPYQTGPACQGAAGSTFCTWDGQDLELRMRVQNSTGGVPIRVNEVRLFEGAPLHEV